MISQNGSNRALNCIICVSRSGCAFSSSGLMGFNGKGDDKTAADTENDLVSMQRIHTNECQLHSSSSYLLICPHGWFVFAGLALL